MIQELNKIAIIHLYILGFEEELDNFSLGLTNPSTQADLLKLEQWTSKITLYKDAVSDPGTGIAAVSSTWAKKHILGFSDDDIKLDLQQQRFEKAIAKELENTGEIIKKTGVFNNIDKLYGDIEKTEEKGGESDEETSTGDGGLGLDLGGGGETEPTPDLGGETTPEVGGETEPTAESYRIEKDLPLILENKGIFLPNFDRKIKESNIEISKLNKQIDDLLNE
jgi:hypothetical protein